MIENITRFELEDRTSSGTAVLTIKGNGDSTEHVVTLRGDQFQHSEIEKLADGIRFSIIGTFEFSDLLDLLKLTEATDEQ